MAAGGYIHSYPNANVFMCQPVEPSISGPNGFQNQPNGTLIANRGHSSQEPSSNLTNLQTFSYPNGNNRFSEQNGSFQRGTQAQIMRSTVPSVIQNPNQRMMIRHGNVIQSANHSNHRFGMVKSENQPRVLNQSNTCYQNSSLLILAGSAAPQNQMVYSQPSTLMNSNRCSSNFISNQYINPVSQCS